MVTLVPIWMSHRPGVWYPSRPQLDLVTLVLNWASPGRSEHAPHLSLILTWLLWFYLDIIGTWLLYSPLGLT